LGNGALLLFPRRLPVRAAINAAPMAKETPQPGAELLAITVSSQLNHLRKDDPVKQTRG